MGAEPRIRECRDVADRTRINGCYGCEQGDAVNPADEPAVAAAHIVLTVLIEGAREGILAREFTKHERDERHAPDDDRNRPDVARSARSKAQGVERVDPDHRAQIAEGDREIVEERENARKLLLVAERRQAIVL